MRIKFNDKIYRLKEVESGVDSLMELVEEPKYKNGDFVYEDGRIIIVKSYPNMYHALAHPEHSNTVYYNTSYVVDFSEPTFRYATAEEKQELIELLRKDGKRWNAEKKCIEDIPVYKDGDFVVGELGSILIFKKADGDCIFDHAYLSAWGELIIDKVTSCQGIRRHATTEEKQRMIEALAERGKRWNDDEKCVEDIPQRKFQAGDKVRIKDGISSETHRFEPPVFIPFMDELIGKELTVRGRGSSGHIRVLESTCIFAEDWLEPHKEELKKGDLAIFWHGDPYYASVRVFERKGDNCFIDDGAIPWTNAVKFECTKEQKEFFNKVRKGEI